MTLAVKSEQVPELLSVRLVTPGGNIGRWSEDERQPENVLSDLEFSDEMPGGYKDLQGTLARNPQRLWPDLEPYGDLQVKSQSGEVLWEGSLDKGPNVSGDQTSITPSALGYQTILEDNQAASVGIIDCDVTKWGEPATGRKKTILAGSFSAAGINQYAESEVTTGDAANTFGPGVLQRLDQVTTARTPVREAWYYGGGVPIGAFRFDAREFVGSAKDPNMLNKAILSPSDEAVSGASVVEGTDYEQVTALNQTLSAGALKNLKYIMLQMLFEVSIPTGDYRNTFGFFNPKVFGAHGMVEQGIWPEIGFKAKQILEYLIPNFASPLTIDTNYIDDDGFIIPQAWYDTMQPIAEIVKDILKYGLYDWFVYHGKRFEYRKPGTYGRFWKAFVAESELNELGFDSQRLWRSVVVQYTDASGLTKTVGPSGSGADVESASLEIVDPEHPAVRAKRTRKDVLDLQGIGTPASAIEVGKRFLEEANLLNSSGSATLPAYVMDSKSILRPSTHVKSGDWISFGDAADPSYRKIVGKRYKNSGSSADIDISAPPSGLEALLERLQAGLISLGVA